MSADVLVAGVGNIFLGDDGFGPEVVRHLGAPEQPPLPEPVRLVDYGIRGLHLSYDLLEGYSALIIVDTMPGHGRPGEIRVVAVDPDDVTADGALVYSKHGTGRFPENTEVLQALRTLSKG